ncbi:MAG: type I restriction enzyme HsdR N-terminal domain-containing protein [Bacteroidales bacterium]|nr:type I restriction enzyme HsdR N-terminal domain-containing protein [Bacteroidales bacterium]
MELIWDPLRRKEVAATPEERVRQWFIIELRDTFGVPEHMMNSEVGFKFGAKPWRADILVYDRAGKPLAVVECKRPDVALDAKVIEQAMRYNSVLGVRYLFVTNGNLTYLYGLKGGSFVPLDRIPTFEEMLCPR